MVWAASNKTRPRLPTRVSKAVPPSRMHGGEKHECKRPVVNLPLLSFENLVNGGYLSGIGTVRSKHARGARVQEQSREAPTTP